MCTKEGRVNINTYDLSVILITNLIIFFRYRNKCEFTVGINEHTGLPTVGFRLSSYAKGEVSVGPIDNLQHIPSRMKKAVKVYIML